MGLPGWLSGKESACQCRRFVGLIPGWKDFLERKWQPTLVLLLGKSHGQRSLVGSMGSQTVRHDQVTKHMHSQKELLYKVRNPSTSSIS